MPTGRRREFVVLFGMLALPGLLFCRLAAAEVDFSRATMGRTTYPAGSWVLDTAQRYTMPDTRDATRDTYQTEAEVEHGVTESLSLGAGLHSTDVARSQVQLGHAILGGRYMALASPLQIAPLAEYRPSLHSQADEWTVGLEALKNFERASVIFQGMADSSKLPGQSRRQVGTLLLGPLYRFGLNGIAGAQWYYSSDGLNYLSCEIGGALSRNIFLGLTPRFGLSPRAEDFQLAVRLHFYFGDYRRQVFGLE